MEVNLGILISALGTILGAMPALLLSNVTHRIKDNLLAYSAGIMVAASTYALIPSTLKLSNMFVLVIGIFLGITTLTLLEISLPHLEMDHSVHSNQKTRPLLLIAAMAIHNIPEGMSVGISYASHLEDLGSLVSFSIGLQNIPEGFLVCLFLITNKIRKVQALLYTSFYSRNRIVFLIYWSASNRPIFRYYSVWVSICCGFHVVCCLQRIDSRKSRGWE